ncbi:MAG TPA: SAM-dependent methyltransferase, partial [Reyranella sp.]|nr:SAM-dependent methyltransferase [Reyranella sp.]
LETLPERPDLAVVDVSFISLRLVLPAIFTLLKPEARIIALVKPQFEAGRREVGKGGVVRDAAVHRRILQELSEWSRDKPWQMRHVLESPIKGPAGNIEFLTLWEAEEAV